MTDPRTDPLAGVPRYSMDPASKRTFATDEPQPDPDGDLVYLADVLATLAAPAGLREWLTEIADLSWDPPRESRDRNLARINSIARRALEAAPRSPESCRHDAQWIADFTRWAIEMHEQRKREAASPETPEAGIDVERLGQPPHRRSPAEDYDPTPHCLYCFKAWDETGGYLPEYRCPESPAVRLSKEARETPEGEK